MQGERSRKLALALLLLGLIAVVPAWSASDTQVYRVSIAPKLSLIPPQWGMIKSYPGLGTANVVFAPSRGWRNVTRMLDVPSWRHRLRFDIQRHPVRNEMPSSTSRSMPGLVRGSGR